MESIETIMLASIERERLYKEQYISFALELQEVLDNKIAYGGSFGLFLQGKVKEFTDLDINILVEDEEFLNLFRKIKDSFLCGRYFPGFGFSRIIDMLNNHSRFFNQYWRDFEDRNILYKTEYPIATDVLCKIINEHKGNPHFWYKSLDIFKYQNDDIPILNINGLNVASWEYILYKKCRYETHKHSSQIHEIFRNLMKIKPPQLSALDFL